MYLPLGKLTILVGAGIVGSVFAQKLSSSNVSDIVSGALKIVFSPLRHNESTSTKSVNKPQNDSLMAQVNSLRQELQILASNRPVTIINSRGTGTRRYGIGIVIVVVGYGYLWWKGWRLPAMMFATRRSLSDARNAIAKRLEDVYSSISITRRHLSSRINGVDTRLDEIAEITGATQDEVSQLQDKSKVLNNNVQSVRYVVQTLESKINRIEGKQDVTNEGVTWLCDYAHSLEHGGSTDLIQGLPSSSSRPAIESPQITTSSRAGSLPTLLPGDYASPESSGFLKPQQSPRNNIASASGLKEVSNPSNGYAATSNGASGDQNSTSSSSGVFGTIFSSGNVPFLSRSRSAVNAVSQQMRSNR